MVEANKKRTKYVYGSVAYDLEPVQEPKKVIKQNKKRKTDVSNKFKLMGRIIVIFVLSFLLVFRFTLVMKLTYDIRASKAEMATLNNNNENIRIELARLNNIKEIEKVATNKCGMIIPAASDVKYVCVKPLTLAPDKYSPDTYRMIQRLLGLIY